MQDLLARPDAHINPTASLSYWASTSPDINGMLGGFPQISLIDLRGSASFLAKLRRLDRPSATTASHASRLCRSVDCGAGIGRVTQGFLAKVSEVVDLVEPVEKFVAEVTRGDTFAGLRAEGRLGEVYVMGLEDFVPGEARYDLIWNQWCVGHLKDEQLVAYLRRCAKGLSADGRGWVVVKENTATGGEDLFDELDSSVTRTDGSFRGIFEQAGMVVVRSELQMGFPKGLGLYPVRFYALRPTGM